MTLNQLKGKYWRLRDEIDSVGAMTPHREARLARLTHELDQIDQELAAARRCALFAPILREEVPWPGSSRQRRNGEERRATAR
jgi:hypothetical protein